MRRLFVRTHNHFLFMPAWMKNKEEILHSISSSKLKTTNKEIDNQNYLSYEK